MKRKNSNYDVCSCQYADSCRVRETGVRQPPRSLRRAFPRSARRQKNRSSQESRRRSWMRRHRRMKTVPKAARPQKSSADSQETQDEGSGSASGTADSAITPGTSQLDALPIPLGTRMQGTHRRPYLRMVFIFHRSGSRSHLQYYPHQRFPRTETQSWYIFTIQTERSCITAEQRRTVFPGPSARIS